MITCDVAKDLLPLIAAGDCSDATKAEVEEHVASCASCRRDLAMMKDPAVAAETKQDKERTGELAKEMTFKKGFRKIRRRWLISIVCVLCILPLSGLGILGYNDVRGEGYAYSNLDDALTVRAFLECLKNKDYEGAFTYVDVEGLYENVTVATDDSWAIDFSNYYTAKIGGAMYYVSSWQDLGAYTDYSAEGRDAKIWAEVILENARGGSSTPIPKHIFAEAAALAGEETDEEITVLTLNSELPNTDFTYMECVAINGEAYYIPTRSGRASGPVWDSNAGFIPEEIYAIMRKDQQDQDARNNAKLDQYRNLGLEEFTRLLKEKYISGFQELEAQGFSLKSYSIGTPMKNKGIFPGIILQAEDSWSFDVDTLLNESADGLQGDIRIGISDGKIQLTGITYYESIDLREVQFINNILPNPYLFEKETDEIGFRFY